ncbi:phage nozzle protein [Pannonibacter sp. SL95]|uniref:phage nozzle protein n=1 Tax=Pannonibacter sp. SL95 TaxID=2995153 RepID=UPI002272C128|nr:hypothetical protein [Pannonibacter sp. SL95]MCY1708359.1 hypothetical protein [Pannonibacter sp. SL95]
MDVDGALKSLLQGVSQQPARDRLPGQCSEQINMSCDPVRALSRRTPTDLVGLLGTFTAVHGIHDFEASDGTKILLIAADDGLHAFDLNANPLPCTLTPSGAAYMAGAGPFRFVTTEDDSTYVINTQRVVQRSTETATFYNNETYPCGMIQVLGGQYGRTFSVKIDGNPVAAYTVPDGSQAAHAPYVATTWITDQIYNEMRSNLSVENWGLYIRDDIILIENLQATDFDLTVNDDSGGVNMKCMTGVVNSVDDLPRTAPNRYVARIAENSDQTKDLHFMFISEKHDTGTPTRDGYGQEGYWQECIAPNTPLGFTADNAPHVLVYDAGSLELRPVAWAKRGVGTLTSAPDPSFVGRRIEDAGLFQERLAFLSGPNAVMSRTKRPDNFFRQTISAVTETDPIDVSSSTDNSTLITAVAHNKDLVIFSRESQFVFSNKTKATPQNSALQPSTTFEADLHAKPVAVGRNVFFATVHGRFSGIREFFTEGSADRNDSRPVTEHVKQYLVGACRHLTASSNYGLLLVHTNTGRETIYPYEYIWGERDQGKVQSAWHKWVFDYPVEYSFFDEDRVYILMRTPEGYVMLRGSLDIQHSQGMGYTVFLDNRFDVEGCDTQFVFPYDYIAELGTEKVVVVQGEGCPAPGMRAGDVEITYVPGTGYVGTLPQSMEGGNVVVGTRFLSLYEPTMPLVKDKDGVAITTGKLIINKFILALRRTVRMVGTVISPYTEFPPVEFNGRRVGFAENVIGKEPLVDQYFSMPVKQDVKHASVQFSTDDHTPMTILDIEWVGKYHKTGRRISTGE